MKRIYVCIYSICATMCSWIFCVGFPASLSLAIHHQLLWFILAWWMITDINPVPLAKQSNEIWGHKTENRKWNTMKKQNRD